MQASVVVAANGAICCKFWPQTILEVEAQNWEGVPLTQGRPLCLGGNPFAPEANSFVPGATPLPLGQPLLPLVAHLLSLAIVARLH